MVGLASFYHERNRARPRLYIQYFQIFALSQLWIARAQA
jgi:hypothetical protein